MKKLTAKDKRYRRKIIEMPCEGCGIEDDTRVPHHYTFVKAGMAKQAPENMAVCLCFYCHSRLHNHGERSFWAGKGRTEEELIEYANELYNSMYEFD